MVETITRQGQNDARQVTDSAYRHLLDRVEDEATWLCCPDVADVLRGRKPFEYLEKASEVAGPGEVGQVRSELLVSVVV